MRKADIPVIFRRGKYGFVQYKFVTNWLPIWDYRRLTLFGWKYIWVFNAAPLENRDADSEEHWTALSDMSLVQGCRNWGELHKVIEDRNYKQEEIFLDAAK